MDKKPDDSPNQDQAQSGRRAIGLRGQKKLEKLHRIKDAAQVLFLEQGYDNTTVRAIARQAEVGLGTLFSYAADKRDLLFLIVNDDFEKLAVEDRRAWSSDAPVIRNLLKVFDIHYKFFSRQPAISRFILRELQFYSDTPQAERFQGVRRELMQVVADILDVGQRKGELRTNFDPAEAAEVVFAVYQAELRHWLGIGDLDFAAGMQRLERSLSLLLEGMTSRRGRH